MFWIIRVNIVCFELSWIFVFVVINFCYNNLTYLSKNTIKINPKTDKSTMRTTIPGDNELDSFMFLDLNS